MIIIITYKALSIKLHTRGFQEKEKHCIQEELLNF